MKARLETQTGLDPWWVTWFGPAGKWSDALPIRMRCLQYHPSGSVHPDNTEVFRWQRDAAGPPAVCCSQQRRVKPSVGPKCRYGAAPSAPAVCHSRSLLASEAPLSIVSALRRRTRPQSPASNQSAERRCAPLRARCLQAPSEYLSYCSNLRMSYCHNVCIMVNFEWTNFTFTISSFCSKPFACGFRHLLTANKQTTS